jgi:hypothetical protein
VQQNTADRKGFCARVHAQLCTGLYQFKVSPPPHSGLIAHAAAGRNPRAVVLRSDVCDRKTSGLTRNRTDAEAFLQKSDATAKPRWINPSACAALFVVNTAR